MKSCKTCQKLRARFLLWFGTKLGVMEPIKQQPKEERKMEFTPQQALVKIGALALENDILTGQLQQVVAERDALRAKYEPQPKVELKEVK